MTQRAGQSMSLAGLCIIALLLACSIQAILSRIGQLIGCSDFAVEGTLDLAVERKRIHRCSSQRTAG